MSQRHTRRPSSSTDSPASSPVDGPPSSSRSDNYPSWLPKRPPPPEPASTFHSSVLLPSDPAQYAHQPLSPLGGRKPTPRSVRIVSVRDEKPDYQTTPGTSSPHHRVWSRATGSAISPGLFLDDVRSSRYHPPRFNAPGFHPDLLRIPSWRARVSFYLLPLITFAHIPAQTFFDFNAVYILLQVAKHPPTDSPGSGKNWALAAAAYIACWLVWFFVVCVLYEFVYSFVRRWRVRRPAMIPLYLSASAFNLVCMTSYTHFCFFMSIRRAAFLPPSSSPFADGTEKPADGEKRAETSSGPGRDWKTALGETCHFYAQNLPTVALLLPRAALCLALLFAFSAPGESEGGAPRDETYFRMQDGSLTTFARAVLIANAVWTAWRVFVLSLSFVGLWILSGQAFGGLCGPRDRWEEEKHERTRSASSATAVLNPDVGFGEHAPDDGQGERERERIVWAWRERSRARVHAAFRFCLTANVGRWTSPERRRPVSSSPSSPPPSGPHNYLGVRIPGEQQPDVVVPEPGRAEERDEDEMNAIFRAVGLSGVPSPARRGVLSDALFEAPRENSGGGLEGPGATSSKTGFGDIIPKVMRQSSGVGGTDGPVRVLPYPFVRDGVGRVGSRSNVAFPSAQEGGGASGSGDEVTEEEDEEEEEDDEEDDEEDEEGEEEAEAEEPQSSGRASGSMSSLGQPITSRYPFTFRQPQRAYAKGHRYTTSGSTGVSSSASPPSAGGRVVAANEGGGRRAGTEGTRSSGSRSTGTGVSVSGLSMSTGNVESSLSGDSGESWDHHHRQHQQQQQQQTVVEGGRRPLSFSSVMPPPPRAAATRTPRAGSRIASAVATSRGGSEQQIEPIVFPSRARTGSEPGLRPGSVSPTHSGSGSEGAEGAAAAAMMVEQPEPEGAQEMAERDDIVGLLGRSTTSFHSHSGWRHSRASSGQSRTSASSSSGSGSGSNSRSRSGSGSGLSPADARSRAQSLIQSLGAASRSSVNVVLRRGPDVRSRAHSSIARLEEDSSRAPGAVSESSSAGEGGRSSGPGEYTFGQPMRPMPVYLHRVSPVGRHGSEVGLVGNWEDDQEDTRGGSRAGSKLSVGGSSERPCSSSERTVGPSGGAPLAAAAAAAVDRNRLSVGGSHPSSTRPMSISSERGLSTAAQSFVTAPGTAVDEGASSAGRSSVWGSSSGVPKGVEGMSMNPV